MLDFEDRFLIHIEELFQFHISWEISFVLNYGLYKYF